MSAKPHHDQPSRDGGAPTPGDQAFEAETIDFIGAGDASAVDADLAAERDRNLRLRAELENVRSRGLRELADQIRYAALPLVRDLLPALDNIDRALDAATNASETGPLIDGFRMVRQQIAAALQQHNFREIPALGELFDPQFHAAILQQPSTDVPANHVTMVAQPGYQIHDRVVRPSQVIVSSGPA